MPMWLKRWLENKSQLLTILVWIIALAVRLYGVTTPPQYYDMATFQAWGAHMLDVGVVHFYDHTWSDYLPLPLYTFAPIVALASALHLPFGLVFKSLMSLVELILIYCITRVWPFKRKIIILLLLALSPVFFGDNAFWGQVDTIPALATALSFLTLSPVLFGLAVAWKPIMIVTAPLLWFLSRKKKQPWWYVPIMSGLTFLASGLPMAGLRAPQLLWERTLEQAGTYPYTTINGWNLWSLVPNLGAWLPDNQIVLGLSLHTWGLTTFGLLSTCLLVNWSRTKWETKYIYRVAATLLILFYAVTTRMHERHLLFGLPLLTLAAGLESWLLVPFALLTVTFTLNLYAALYWVNHAQTWPFGQQVISLISWVTTLVAVALAIVWDWPQAVRSTLRHLRSHKLLIGILMIAALLRLGNLGFPSTYIFDEVYHAFTAREYLHNHKEAWEWWTTPPPGVAYEWTHPPIAKYGMVIGMQLFGENSFGWRFGSAVAGVISIWGLYLLVKEVTRNKKIALLASFLLTIEGLHIAQSRIAMNDMYMLVFFVWSLYAAIKARWKTAAILYGLSLASKWSGLYGIIPLALIYLHDNPLKRSLPTIIRATIQALRLLLIGVIVYLLTFTPFIVAGHTWSQLIELHRQMWYYHTHLVATHAYQSVPVQWIFAARPVWYYVNYGQLVSNIYVQGNPLILWLGLAALIMQLKQLLRWPQLLFGVLYLVFIVPWIFSPRIMFFYHYLPSATFLCVILAMWLNSLSLRLRIGILVLCCLSLCVLSPILYGFPMPQPYWDTLFKILPSWK